MYKKIFTILLATAVVVAPLLAQQKEEELKKTLLSEYVQGKIDGERDGTAAASPIWILAGVGCGIFGVGLAFLVPPSVPAERLVGKSADYAAGYADRYKSSGKMRQTLYACAGWLTWVLIYLAIVAMGGEVTY